MKKRNDPIDNIQWIENKQLKANDYNPNVVFNQELKLLELSILKQGYVQPILVDQDFNIIDGFHRWTLSKMSKSIMNRYKGFVPCVILDLPIQEKMLLTIRINRAKGSHVAIKMAEIVIKLVDDYSLPIEYIAENIGANKDEVELLYQNSIFKRKNLQSYEYSRAWEPKPKNKRG